MISLYKIHFFKLEKMFLTFIRFDVMFNNRNLISICKIMWTADESEDAYELLRRKFKLSLSKKGKD